MKLATLEADVTLNVTGFNEGVKDASAKMNDMKVSLDGLAEKGEETGGVLGAAIGHALGDVLSGVLESVIQATFELVSGSIELASSMEEVRNVIDVTFGDNAARVYTWSNGITQSFGIGEVAALKYAGTMGAVLSGMGLSSEQAYNMSTALVELAGDMASFYNMDADTAFTKIMSGITGEMEPLKQLGIVMSTANLEAHALTMGLQEKWSKMDAATQTLVRYSYLMESTTLAQGDFSRSSESYANQMRLLEENIANLQLSIGEALLPVLTDLVSWFNGLFGAGEDGAKAMKDITSELSQTYATIDTTAANALELVDALAKMEEQGIHTTDEQNVWNQLLKNLSATLPELNGYINATTGEITGGTEALRAYVKEWQTTQRELAVTAAMQKYQAEIAAQMEKVADLQIQAAANRMAGGDASAEKSRYYELAAEQYYPGQTVNEDVDVMNILQRLNRESKKGDPYAQVLLSQIESVDEKWEGRERTEQNLKAAEFELQLMEERYEVLQKQIEAMLEGTSEKDKEGGKASDSDDSEGEPAAQATTINLYVSVDGQEVAAVIEPRVEDAVTGNITRRFKVASMVTP